MRRAAKFSLSLAAVVAVLSGCGDTDSNDFCDGWLNPGGQPPPPITPLVNIGLFSREPFGLPLCGNATVRASQSVGGQLLERSTFVRGGLTVDGAHLVEIPSEEPCNLFHGAEVGWTICGEPLHYEVERAGCTPVVADYQWSDNYWEGQLDVSWHVPVILDCSPP